MFPRQLPQLDQLQFFRCAFVDYYYTYIFPLATDNLSAHNSYTIIPMAIYTQCFPYVKYNYYIHILYTIFRVIYHSRFSVCVFCVLIFRSYCNSIFRVVLAPDFSVGVLIACIFIPRLRFIPCRASELFRGAWCWR